MIYGYDGDFDTIKTGDDNYSDNGLLNPDRIPNPHVYEVGYFYQNIWTTPGDLSKVKSIFTMRISSVICLPIIWNGKC